MLPGGSGGHDVEGEEGNGRDAVRPVVLDVSVTCFATETDSPSEWRQLPGCFVYLLFSAKIEVQE